MSAKDHLFGLIGKTLNYSFSKSYFDEKFFREGIQNCRYKLYEIPTIDGLRELIAREKNIRGLNVTNPYKEEIIPYLDTLNEEAETIKAVNVIDIKDGLLTGYNTDKSAFSKTLTRWFPNPPNSCAIVLGTGGASKAVQQALKELEIPCTVVSRSKKKRAIDYEELKHSEHMATHNLIINTTPLGMSPNTEVFPPISYDNLTPDHYVYDLIYNPARTFFLQKAEIQNAHIKNGLEMLHVQAENSWSIWNH